MHLKPRPDNVLMNLPAGQREKLNQWLTEHSYAKVQALLALPIPEGMGLRTHTTSIGRYYKRVMPAYLNPDRKDPDALIREIAATPDFTGTFDNATVTELKRRIYHAASNPTTRVPDLVRICKFVLPLRRTTP